MTVIIKSAAILVLVISAESLTSNDCKAQQIFVSSKGNTWVINNTDDKIDHKGIHQWQDPKSVLGTFFKVIASGSLDLSVLASVAEGKSTLKFSLNDKSYNIEIDEAATDTIKVGRFNITNPGYQQLNLQGLNRTSSDFANIEGFLLEGPAIDSHTTYVKDDFYWGRRGPSVHLNYEIPEEAGEVVWFYNEITVPEGEDVEGSYFMANGFAEGYFGIQVNSAEERRVLFSVWSPYKTDDPGAVPEEYKIIMLAKGEKVYTGEFGNEGSGGQSFLRYMWQAGNTYRFLLKGEPSENNSTDYTAYFYAPELDKWLLIASFRRPKTSTYLKRPHSFLENFITETGHIRRRVYYTNQWVYDTNKNWYEITEAGFTADATARKGSRLDYLGGSEGSRFFLENCGFFNIPKEIGSKLIRKPSGTSPLIDLSALPK
jgi:hypothetical protein